MTKSDDRKFFRELPRKRLYPERIPVTAAEFAERLGIHIATLYRIRVRLELEDGLPAPLTRRGPLKWDRLSIDAWFSRHHPAIAKFANDDAPVGPPPALRPDDEAMAERVLEHYSRSRKPR